MTLFSINDSSKAPSDQTVAERLLRLRSMPDNKFCADCGQSDPEWASITIGVLICVQCSGCHRHLGTHISRVRSLKLDEWTQEAVEKLERRGGNNRCNEYFLHHLPPCWRRILPSDPQYVREEWIRAKYGLKDYTPEKSPNEFVPVKGGFLWKKGKTGSKWFQRFFVLSGHQLIYYKNQNDIASPLGVISMDQAKLFIVDNKLNRPLSFQIITGNCDQTSVSTRSYFLSADSARDALNWINVLRLAKAQALGLLDRETLRAKGMLPSFTGTNLEFEKRLGCEIVHEGWALKLCDPQDLALPVSPFSQLPPTTTGWQSLIKRSTNMSSHPKWLRVWLLLDLNYLWVYRDPLAPFPLGRVEFPRLDRRSPRTLSVWWSSSTDPVPDDMESCVQAIQQEDRDSSLMIVSFTDDVLLCAQNGRPASIVVPLSPVKTSDFPFDIGNQPSGMVESRENDGTMSDGLTLFFKMERSQESEQWAHCFKTVFH